MESDWSFALLLLGNALQVAPHAVRGKQMVRESPGRRRPFAREQIELLKI
jgi:hypothetical protein